MKFASFETIVEAIYGQMPKSKSEYGKGVQTGVSFAGGYLAGILCAIVSHPADVMVSKLNANRQPGEAFGGAMSRIYKDIGFGGLWNGLVLRIFMIGTLTSLRKYPSSMQAHFDGWSLTLWQNGVSTTASRSSWVFQRPVELLRHRSKLPICNCSNGRNRVQQTLGIDCIFHLVASVTPDSVLSSWIFHALSWLQMQVHISFLCIPSWSGQLYEVFWTGCITCRPAASHPCHPMEIKGSTTC